MITISYLDLSYGPDLALSKGVSKRNFPIIFRIGLFLVCSALFFQGCGRKKKPQDSCGFVPSLENQRVAWPSRKLPIKLFIHESVPPEAYAALDEAVKEYNTRLSRPEGDVFQVFARGVKDEGQPVKDGNSTIYWQSDWDPAQTTEQARTTIYWSGSEIFEADMRINAKNFSFFTSLSAEIAGVDLTSLLVHELGHMLGLAHNDSPGSVMNFSLDEGQNRRHLSGLDFNNLKCEY